MDWLAIVGDAVWIMSLSLIAGGSRATWRLIPPGVSTPLPMILGYGLQWRAPKAVALLVTPVAATVFGLALSLAARRPPAFEGAALVVFGLRMLTAPPFLLLHLLHLKRAVEVTTKEHRL